MTTQTDSGRRSDGLLNKVLGYLLIVGMAIFIAYKAGHKIGYEQGSDEMGDVCDALVSWIYCVSGMTQYCHSEEAADAIKARE